MDLTIVSRTPQQMWSDRTLKIAKKWKKEGSLNLETTKKLILACIKSFDEDSYEKLSLKTKTNWTFLVCDLIKTLTPRQFCQIMPIKKDFNGHKYGCKDYFSTRKFIEDEIGWDSKIPNGFQFLMEFWADDVFELSAWMMLVVSDNQRRQSGKSMFEKFAEENGIHLLHIDELEGGV